MLAARPSLYIDEQIYHLWDTFGVHIDAQAIGRMLKRVKWSKKKVLFTPYFHRIISFTDANTSCPAQSRVEGGVDG